MSNISIKEIAQKAGVSRGTVDRALNNRYGINPKLKEEILKVAEELGYKANRAGKILGLRKSPIKIGIHLPSEGNEFFNELIQGITDSVARHSDFGVTADLVTTKGFNSEKQIQVIQSQVNSGANAIVLVPIDSMDVREYLCELKSKDIPVITINSDISNAPRLAYIGNDYFHSGRVAAGANLLMHPYPSQQNILILTGSRNVLGHNERIAGFANTLNLKPTPGSRTKKHNLLDIYETQDDENIAYSLTKRATAENERIDLIYIAAGGTAGVCKAVQELPTANRPKIIANDLTTTERHFLKEGIIALTITQDPYTQGSRAIEYIFEYFLSGTLPPNKSITQNNIVIRECIT